MPINAKDVLRAIRNVPKPEVRRSLLEDLLAQEVGQTRADEIHQSQLNITRQREYENMLQRMEELRKAQAKEQERLDKIAETRLQNLKKARRKLKRLRSKNE